MTVFNVMDVAYAGGAKNDSTTNDAAAINAAIAAANAAGGGVVYFPAGSGYKTNSSFTNLNTGVSVLGEGWNASIIKPNFHGNTFTIPTGQEGIAIRQIGIAPIITQNTGYAIEMTDGLSVVIEDVNIFDRFGHVDQGIHVKGSGGYKVYINRVQVNGAIGDGIVLGTYNTTEFPQNTFIENCEVALCNNGITAFGGYTEVYNTECLTNRANGFLTYPDNGGVVGIKIVSCLSDTNQGHGYKIDAGGAGAGGKVTGLEMDLCWAGNNGNLGSSWNASGGIYMNTEVEQLKIGNCYTAVNGIDGMYLRASKNAQINDNRVEGNGQAGPAGTYGGFTIASGAAIWQVNGNVFDGQSYGTYPQKQGWGITVNPALTKVALVGNIALNNTVANWNLSTLTPLTNTGNV